MIYLGYKLNNILDTTDNENYNSFAYLINKKGCQMLLENVLCYHQFTGYILNSYFNSFILGTTFTSDNNTKIGYFTTINS